MARINRKAIRDLARHSGRLGRFLGRGRLGRALTGFGNLLRTVDDILELLGSGNFTSNREVDSLLRELRRQGVPAGDEPIVLQTVPDDVVEARQAAPGPYSPPRPGEESPFGVEHLTPDSSNVFSYSFRAESRRIGTMYVRYKAWRPGMQDRPNQMGTLYAYYDVPVAKYNAFLNSSSAGEAVWSYLRRRGSQWAHQHQYRLLQGSVSERGVYIPRRAVARNRPTIDTLRRSRMSPESPASSLTSREAQSTLVSRALPVLGSGRRGFRRSTLPVPGRTR
jgi:hypothetical protein